MSRRAWKRARDVPVTAADLQRLADGFDWDAWAKKLHAVVAPHYTGIAIEQGEREAAAHALEFDASDPFVDRFFTSYLGERITQLDETTRDLVREELQSAFAEGKAESLQDLAGRIRAINPEAFSPARALKIARTEAGYAYGHGAGLAYRQNGIAHVEISDGDGCKPCQDAGGQIWTVDESLSDTLAHPGCVRSAAPIVDYNEEN